MPLAASITDLFFIFIVASVPLAAFLTGFSCISYSGRMVPLAVFIANFFAICDVHCRLSCSAPGRSSWHSGLISIPAFLLSFLHIILYRMRLSPNKVERCAPDTHLYFEYMKHYL
jgi:hypothetical protein